MPTASPEARTPFLGTGAAGAVWQAALAVLGVAGLLFLAYALLGAAKDLMALLPGFFAYFVFLPLGMIAWSVAAALGGARCGRLSPPVLWLGLAVFPAAAYWGMLFLKTEPGLPRSLALAMAGASLVGLCGSAIALWRGRQKG